MNTTEMPALRKPPITRALTPLMIVGAVALVGGAILAPERTWPSLLLVSLYLLGLGLAGAFLVALEYVTGATWSIAFRRVPEAMTAILPAAGAGIVLVLLGGAALYPWGGHDALHGFKALWLARPFVLGRAAIYLSVWLLLAAALIRTSRRQDEDGDLAHTVRNRRLSAIFVVTFAVTFWLASADWIMALDPHWYSTMFGLYNFAGLFLSGLAAVTLLSLTLRRTGALPAGVPSPDHCHDLGKLLFAFSSFWMYIWFSQYMLIWYVNISEETPYFVARLQPGWRPFLLLSLLLNWVVPFVILLPRAAKRSATVLTRVSLVILAGRWVDLYVMIGPSVPGGEQPLVGVWEIALTLGAAALFGAVFLRAFGAVPSVPRRDPFLAESLRALH